MQTQDSIRILLILFLQVFVADMLKIVGAMEGDNVLRLSALWCEPERRFQAPAIAHGRVVSHHRVVERRGLRRTGGRQFLVGEADRETPRVILAHLGVGVLRQRRDEHVLLFHADVPRPGQSPAPRGLPADEPAVGHRAAVGGLPVPAVLGRLNRSLSA
mgnify:CR=1 FL=1